MKPFLVLSLCLSLLACDSDNGPQKKRASETWVEITQVSREPLKARRIITGTLEAASKVRIFNQEQGRLVSLPYYEGDRVKQNTVLAEIDDTLIRSELDKASASLKQAELDLQRLTRLMKRNLASDDELARAKTALEQARAEETLLRTRLAHTRVRAPFDGIVSERLLEPGDVVPVYSHILSLIDPSYLKADIRVSELLLTNIKVGDPVAVRIDALGDQRYSARVARIHPTIDPDNRQGTIEITLQPVPQGALPGQLCRATLTTQSTPRRSIPFAALRHDNQGEYVYRVDKDDKVRFTRVVTGIQLGTRIEILDGLHEGDKVIIKGFLGLRDGKSVKTIQTATSSEASSPNAANTTAPQPKAKP